MNNDKYQPLLRRQYSSVSDNITQSRMKYLHSWATEVEIKVAADCFGLDMYTLVMVVGSNIAQLQSFSQVVYIWRMLVAVISRMFFVFMKLDTAIVMAYVK